VFLEELGLRKFLENAGHTFVVTSDKDGAACQADRELVDADVVISQPFFPYYLTRTRIESAPNCTSLSAQTRYAAGCVKSWSAFGMALPSVNPTSLFKMDNLLGWEPTPTQRALPPPARKKPPITKNRAIRPAGTCPGCVPR